jgi:hypothetical protein
MNPGGNRWKLRLAAMLAAGGLMLIWALRQQGQQPESALTIVNQSGQTIALLKITVSGRTSTVKGVAAGGEVIPTGTIQSDEPFSVEVTLADGNITTIKGKTADRLKLIVSPGGQISPRLGDKG